MVELLAWDPTGERARLLLAARSAPVAVAAFLASLVGYALLLPMAPAYGALANAASLVLALAMAGMATGFAELTFHRAPRVTSAAATVGVLAGLAGAALALGGLAGGGIALLQAQGLAFAALGAWLALANGVALAVGAGPRWAGVLGGLAGVGFGVGALGGDPASNPLALAVAGTLTVAGFPAWAFAARRAMRAAVHERPMGPLLTGVNA